MRKFLFFIVLSGLIAALSPSYAQTLKDPNTPAQKADDGLLVVYPNPAKDYLAVRSKDNALKIKTVTFYSILGVEVATYNLNQNSAELRLDRLKPGKYLMRSLMSDNSQKITQIIKQ
ncbi:T9SS type A sorting domain-containing protein [Bergeyella sp. RCAD1439]|uniref:T9SS type A sorting domain-containing protein n=1 Tax=Bergeyella anatis TaxID=3113737 RepID=UPI002E17B6ED|nr:T9SS type A sorting domain-containing protein [Bergeyella sp. RCAD1439]